MRTYNKDLRRARRWLSSGRSSKVIRFLEPKVPLFLEDPQYYAILGRACLYSGLLKDADTYLNRGLQADPGHMEVRLTLAVNHLKRKDPSSAVRTWLEILEDDASQRCARRGLRSLKRISDQHQQDRFLEKFDPARYLPPLYSKWSARILSALVLALIILTCFYFREPLGNLADSLLSSEPSRPGMEGLMPVKGTKLSGSSEQALHSMSENDISRSFKKALDHFDKYEDNSARYELNLVMNSNATPEVRARAKLMIESLGEADIENLETSYSYEDVVDRPWAYEGCLVLWKGKTANIEYGDEAIRFDFLVGFEEEKVLKGKVPVAIPFLVVMEPLPLELLAAVEPGDRQFTLQGKTLHFLR